MKSLPERIMEHAEATPEATPICPAALLHIGQRAAVGQALSRLARSGRLMRIRQGVYMRPIQTRFGRCAPGIEKSPQALSELWGETIVPNGGGAANWLERPVRSSAGVQGRHLLVQGVAGDPGGSRKTSTSPTTSETSHRIWLPVPATRRWTKAIRPRLAEWVRERAGPFVQEGLARAGFVAWVRAEAERLHVTYEPLFQSFGTIRPEVKVDFGARSTGEPHAAHAVVCDAAAYRLIRLHTA